MEPRELLRALMERDGLNPSSLAKAVNNETRQPQIHKFLSGAAKEPKQSTLLPIAQHFKVPVSAFYNPGMALAIKKNMDEGLPLLAGIGADPAGLIVNEEPFRLPEGAIRVLRRPRRIWVVGKGAGGLAERIWDDGDYPVGATEDYTTDINSPDPQAFLVAVEGPSMWPKYEDGNFALIEPGTEPELEDVVLVRLRTGETMLKRLLSRRGRYRLGSFNDPQILEYAPEEVSWVYYSAHEVPRRRIKSRNGGVL